MKLIADFRNWYKYWSNQLAILAGIAAVYAVDNRGEIILYLAELPSPYRQIITILLVTVLPITIRMLSQPKLEKKDGV